MPLILWFLQLGRKLMSKKDSLQKMFERDMKREYFNDLSKRYKKYLEQSLKDNSFEAGFAFIKQNVQTYEFKSLGVSNYRALAIKLTNHQPPPFWD